MVEGGNYPARGAGGVGSNMRGAYGEKQEEEGVEERGMGPMGSEGASS